MGRGAMGRGKQEGGDREVGKREGEKKGHEEGGISQMDRNAWVDIWNAWVERDYGVFLLCLPVQRRVPRIELQADSMPGATEVMVFTFSYKHM